MRISFRLSPGLVLLAFVALVLLIVMRDALASGACVFVPLVGMPRTE